MPTLKQIEANRRNAQKSTGPRTPEGKAVSKMNALKSGINAEALLIRMEEQADLETLIAEYYQRFQPATPEERCFVDILIRDEWHLRRFGAIEAELWEHQLTLLDDDEPYPRGHAFQLADSTFARLQRRIDQTERSYKNALHELERLQQSRERFEADVPSIPQSIANKTTSPEIGFVPQAGTRGEGRAPSAETHPPLQGASPQFPRPPLRANAKDGASFSNECGSPSQTPRSRRLGGESAILNLCRRPRYTSATCAKHTPT
jgi:hypothetical protein